ncbi:unnamed protein product [Urochloa humidicola]
MADIAFNSVGKIIKVAGKIKEAVDTVKQNKEECEDIKSCVARVEEILGQLDQTAMNQAMSNTLDDLAKSVDKALELVKKYQQKHIISHLWGASSMAKKLNKVQKDIRNKLQMGDFATHVSVYKALHPQDAGAGTISHGQSTSDARPEEVNRQKGKTAVATVSRAQSDPLSGIAKFSFSQLKDATNGFSHVLRRGGFGIVYKGILQDERDVAIKKLLISGHFPDRELDYELNIIARLQHKNIVKLLGYCVHMETEERLYFLVQEYMPKGSLKSIINASGLDWPSCFQIIQGIARGVHYLHKQRVIYMDLKPANILLDSKMNPVIIDFGLSVVLNGNDDEITWDSVAGTMEYIAPENIKRAKISMKSDVFSFGVILIEIITGRRVAPSTDIPEWGSLDMIRSFNGLFDPALLDESKLVDINKCRDLGLMCIEWDPNDRPTMAEVLELLNS